MEAFYIKTKEVEQLQERSFWTKEVAEQLEIGTSTLRKWCLALEQENYSFVKGAKNSRAFVQKIFKY